jgi:hypothetical protein
MNRCSARPEQLRLFSGLIAADDRFLSTPGTPFVAISQPEGSTAAQTHHPCKFVWLDPSEIQTINTPVKKNLRVANQLRFTPPPKPHSATHLRCTDSTVHPTTYLQSTAADGNPIQRHPQSTLTPSPKSDCRHDDSRSSSIKPTCLAALVRQRRGPRDHAP